MNLLDLGIIIILGLITLRGYYRGLFQELAVLVGVVGGLVTAAHAYPHLAARLHPWIQNPSYANWLAFGVILVAFYWLTRLLAHALQRVLYHLYLDFLDRLLGGFFALIKGGLLIGFALLVLGVVMPRDSPLLKQSYTAPYLRLLAKRSLEFFPPDFKQRMNDYLRDWQKPRKKQEASKQGAVNREP